MIIHTHIARELAHQYTDDSIRAAHLHRTGRPWRRRAPRPGDDAETALGAPGP